MTQKTKHDHIIQNKDLMTKINEKIKNEVKDIIEKVLPNSFNIILRQLKSFNGDDLLFIGASPSTYEINKAKGEYPEFVSLELNLSTFNLEPQAYSGIGGNHFYIKIRQDLFPKEKCSNLGIVKIPFRKPKKELKYVYKSIEIFFERYIELLKEWKDNLKYKEKGNYLFLNNN